MVHIALVLDIVSFSLGLVAGMLTLFAWARMRLVIFRQLALVFGAGLLVLTVSMLKTYDAATTADFGRGATGAYALLAAVGFGGFFYMLPVIAFSVSSVQPSPRRVAFHAGMAVLIAALAAWRELDANALSDAIALAPMIVIQVYAVAFVLPRITASASRPLVTLVRRLSGVTLLACAAGVARYVLIDLVRGLVDMRAFPFTQVTYFVLGALSLLAFALRFPYGQGSGAVAVSEGFMRRYGISPREKEIIELIVSGHSNRMIAETLFISAMTVKNHIYHIYQKTGVENKIQLLNLMKTVK